MARSAKKGPYVDEKLLKKINRLEEEGRREVIRTWARDSDISPEMVGHRIAIHNGRDFKEILVTESMVGHKLGEFSHTRRFTSHSKKGYIKPEEEEDDE